METLRRTIHPEIRVIDSKTGMVEYVASDESIDSYREVIRANGWRFNRFSKNAPFVDSHDYSTLEKLVGKVVDFSVKGKQLVETVQWAIDVADNKLAQLGWKMTEAGYLKAVSVGFMPTRYLTKWDAQDARLRGDWLAQLQELGMQEENAPRVIYLEQEQVELSACIIGANMNALAKSYKAGFMDDDLMEKISLEQTKRTPADVTDEAADVALARQRQRKEFLRRFEAAIKRV
jgi:hypothetical protein